jgi:hypothetical protein
VDGEWRSAPTLPRTYNFTPSPDLGREAGAEFEFINAAGERIEARLPAPVREHGVMFFPDDDRIVAWQPTELDDPPTPIVVYDQQGIVQAQFDNGYPTDAMERGIRLTAVLRQADGRFGVSDLRGGWRVQPVFESILDIVDAPDGELLAVLAASGDGRYLAGPDGTRLFDLPDDTEFVEALSARLLLVGQAENWRLLDLSGRDCLGRAYPISVILADRVVLLIADDSTIYVNLRTHTVIYRSDRGAPAVGHPIFPD